jgi:ABC-type bacteriocin/lantibiotic exporter with double-glycine peptidase domain
MSIEESNAKRCLDTLVVRDAKTQLTNYQNDALEDNVVVRLENVSFRYQDAVIDVVDRVCLTIKEGDSLAVIGRSGSGKSTLIDLLIGAVKPTSGRIVWNENQAGKIGFMPQISIATGMKIANSVALEWDVNQIDQKQIDNLLIDAKKMKMFDLHNFDDETKDSEMSVGQLQVIGLMRAVYRNPKVLILDEPTSALDEESQTEIMRFVETMNIRSKVIVAHRLATIRSSSRVICMEAGKIIADGSFKEVLDTIPNIENYIETESIVNGSKNDSPE